MFLTNKEFRALLPDVRPADSFSGPQWPSSNDRGQFDEGEAVEFIVRFRAHIAALPIDERRLIGPSQNGAKAAKRAGTSLASLQDRMPYDGLNSFGVRSWLITSLDQFRTQSQKPCLTGSEAWFTRSMPSTTGSSPN
jgi:hypothetical protein